MATQLQHAKRTSGELTGELAFMNDRAAELDAQVTRVLGRADLDEPTAELLRLLAGHKGAANAICIREIVERLTLNVEQWDPRTVKAAVKDLVERFGIPIGGSRKKPYGYFLILTAEDQADAARPLRRELESLSRRLRKLIGKMETARLFGQIQLQLDRQDGGKAT